MCFSDDTWQLVALSLFLLDTGVFRCPTTSCRPCHPTFLPGFHLFSECVCFLWLCTECCAWVKVLNVCVSVYVWVYMTAVWPNIKCLLHMDRTSGLYIQAWVHTDVHAQTDTERHSGWIGEIVAAHALAHVVYTRTPLRCGVVVVTCLHSCMCMHACLSLSFSFGENTVVFMLHYCVWPYLFLFVHFYEHAQQLSTHTRAHTFRDHSHTLELRWWRVWRWFALAPHTVIHTNMHTCVYVFKYIYRCIYIYIYMYIYIYILFVCFSDYTWQLVP